MEAARGGRGWLWAEEYSNILPSTQKITLPPPIFSLLSSWVGKNWRQTPYSERWISGGYWPAIRPLRMLNTRRIVGGYHPDIQFCLLERMVVEHFPNQVNIFI